MILTIVIIAAVTALLCTLMICSSISIRESQPCLFAGRVVFTAASRYDGGACIGKADNVFLATIGPAMQLHDTRVCNGHVPLLMDVVSQLTREEK